MPATSLTQRPPETFVANLDRTRGGSRGENPAIEVTLNVGPDWTGLLADALRESEDRPNVNTAPSKEHAQRDSCQNNAKRLPQQRSTPAGGTGYHRTSQHRVGKGVHYAPWLASCVAGRAAAATLVCFGCMPPGFCMCFCVSMSSLRMCLSFLWAVSVCSLWCVCVCCLCTCVFWSVSCLCVLSVLPLCLASVSCPRDLPKVTRLVCTACVSLVCGSCASLCFPVCRLFAYRLSVSRPFFVLRFCVSQCVPVCLCVFRLSLFPSSSLLVSGSLSKGVPDSWCCVFTDRMLGKSVTC